jgi:hypothetical protein
VTSPVVFQVYAAAKELHRQVNLSVGLLPASLSLPDEAGARSASSQVSCDAMLAVEHRNKVLPSLNPSGAGS